MANKRINLLSESDLLEIFGAPTFSPDERVLFFKINRKEKAIVDSLRSTRSKLFFILQLGIFKKKHQFFVIKKGSYAEELEHIHKTYFVNSRKEFTPPSLQSLKNQRKTILGLMKFRTCTQKDRILAEEHCLNLAKLAIDKEFLFKRLHSYFEDQKIVAPSYSFFCKLISKALVEEQSRLFSIIKRHLKDQDNTDFDLILIEMLGALKNEPKDFSLKEMRKEIERFQIAKKLFSQVNQVVQSLDISMEGIKYYASLIDYYQDYRIKKIRQEKATLYLYCFVYIKYFEINDNLIKAFIYHTNKVISDSKEYAKEHLYKHREDNKKTIKYLPMILDLILDESMGDKKLSEVQNSIFQSVTREDLSELNKSLRLKSLDLPYFEWKSIAESQSKFIKYLRPIVKVLDLESSLTSNPTVDAIRTLKLFFESKDKIDFSRDLPEDFISAQLEKYFKNEVENSYGCYEFYVYKSLKHGFESGDIFVNQSISYKSFEKDLLQSMSVPERKQLERRSSVLAIKQSTEETLKVLEKELHNRIKSVNERIKNQENPYIKLSQNGEKWSLRYDGRSVERDFSLFGESAQIGISDLIRYVNLKCPFLNVFNHVLSSNVNTANQESILACIISYGTNLGLYRMSQISNLTYKELIDTAQSFVRPESLKKANDLLVNEISKLPTFEYFNLENEAVHSSSDGQKFEVQRDSLNTRYSSKYFGLGKGVSCYTLVANHVPINAKIIGANEYEGHYVFDLIYNNTTKVVPKIHSTDTHGVNQINFCLLDFFGYQFAPRYKNFSNRRFYSFSTPSEYKDIPLKPFRKINRDLIIQEWENIKKIILSLENKSSTQAIIVQKLSSYKRQNKTKQALWEYNKILESLYILNYIDDVYLRRNVQKALNIGEAYHQMKRSVAFANHGKIKAQTEREQIIWSESCRLITNCIIYYNSLILTEALENQSSDFILKLKNKSPMAWRHINFYGNYEFKSRKVKISIEDLARQLAHSPQESVTKLVTQLGGPE